MCIVRIQQQDDTYWLVCMKTHQLTNTLTDTHARVQGFVGYTVPAVTFAAVQHSVILSTRSVLWLAMLVQGLSCKGYR